MSWHGKEIQPEPRIHGNLQQIQGVQHIFITKFTDISRTFQGHFTDKSTKFKDKYALRIDA